MTTGHSQNPTDVSATETLREPAPSNNLTQPASESFLLTPPQKTTVPDEIDGSVLRPHPVRETSIDPGAQLKTIPPTHDHRTLILCFDGTGDQFDCDNSNVVQLVSLLKKNEKAQQMVYYQAGIGTYTSPQIATPIMSKVSKSVDSALAWNLNAHVMDGYEFLMQNYTHGDKICIFGFSRGAYVARSLAGMIHKVGLLPADNWQQVPFAYKMYTRTDLEGWEQSNAFKRAFSCDVKIEFLGVWDTVDSVGILSKRLPFVTSNTIVRTFRHAISLDERRAKFKANCWNRPSEEEAHLGLSNEHLPEISSVASLPKDAPSSSQRPSFLNISPRLLFRDLDEDKELDENERKFSEQEAKMTSVEEVWFAGCHCDVGGGSVANKTRHSLARIPLRWMIRECFKANTGIMFDTDGLRRMGLDPSTLYPFVTPRPPALSPGADDKVQKLLPVSRMQRLINSLKKIGRSTPVGSASLPPSKPVVTIGTEEQEELKDALAPAYDRLKIARVWWILEILPLPYRYQRDDDTWKFSVEINNARPRVIPRQDEGVKVHRSVKVRMETEYASKKKYRPKAMWRPDIVPDWVD